MFPHAVLQNSENDYGEIAKKILKNPTTQTSLRLYASGTEFQFAVWRALLNVPFGTLSSYKHIAELIKKPKAVRAVGTTIGRNPIALLIPCHRIISFNGGLGGYFWGLETKKKILDWEMNWLK
ncbi:hypothetical protein CHS0354_000492 [Potamilus streckersoni]|uniref:Methylated-DNA--protein-cysteine methyltransferase n=1 Tax=Potamilus streckersoni TaxID=2493646 RepID=A0AAE0W956_9BIVA|nr:hypothetical protein CHS0354_000492 [Potamilus streckersoni]